MFVDEKWFYGIEYYQSKSQNMKDWYHCTSDKEYSHKCKDEGDPAY